jgi:sugar phosphate isomerase/epimerase
MGPRIYHVHMKDAYWANSPRRSGVYGGMLPFGDPQRYWDFRSPGRGNIDFEDVIRVLHEVGYRGPLSVEWEDASMDREHGAEESCEYVRGLDFAPNLVPFTDSFRQM